MPSALLGDQVDGAAHEVRRHGVTGCAMVGVDHDLEGPARPVTAAIGAKAQLGIAHRMGVAGFPGDEPGKALPPSLDQVEPGMLAERGMGVGLARSVQEPGDRRKVFTVEVAHDPDIVHLHEASSS